MTLELIVRPFQRGEVTPPLAVPGGTKLADPVVVKFASQGDAAIFDWSFSSSISKSSTAKTHKEVSRTSQQVRIANPQDPSQFVDINRATSVTFANAAKPKDKETYKFAYGPNDA
jgi:hypothetical protein